MKDEIKENNETTIYDYKFVSIKDIKNQLQYKKIKEILDKLNNSAEHYILYDYEVKQLLDYITNLQEENERLKKDKNIIFDANCNLSKVMNDYKQRIDKAIEYIEKEKYDIETTFRIKSKEFLQENVTSVVPSFKLLEILKGE